MIRRRTLERASDKSAGDENSREAPSIGRELNGVAHRRRPRCSEDRKLRQGIASHAIRDDTSPNVESRTARHTMFAFDDGGNAFVHGTCTASTSIC